MEVAEFARKHADLIAKFKAELAGTMRPACAILHAQKSADLLDSRFGGPIAWPEKEPIPTDAKGVPMAMALQINFAEVEAPEGFPKTGLLQLFLANDIQERQIAFLREHRSQGAFPLHNGDGFKIVYHQEPASLVQKDYALPDLEFAIWQPDLPSRPHGVALAAPVNQARPYAHWQNDWFLKALDGIPEIGSNFSVVWAFLCKELWDDHGVPAPHLGGYHAPYQQDQRVFFAEYQKYDRCLIALAPMPGIDCGDMSLSLLIEGERLAAADFSDVVAVADAD